MKKMGQIVRRKKKGRPSKADLAKRGSSGNDTSAPESELRRSHRQRSVRYTFDFDDYLDDEELFEDFDNEEDKRRREKKLELLLKLQTSKETTPTESTPSETRRVYHAHSASQSSSDFGGGESNQPSKKRKLSRVVACRGGGGGGGDEEEDEEGEGYENDDVDDDDDDNDNENVGDEEVVEDAKAEPKGQEGSAPGTPTEVPSGLPLPDKKTLELILDKLQKKDIYGVYAEPVDPEELPDYHEVIEHPMDFATVRNKLGNGSYATLEQFESDVFLICSNAMQYNASDTIYHKQARTIQELAKMKFQKVRIGIELSEELKSEQKIRLGSAVKKLIKKPINRTLQDPVGSDFSSGATLATTGDFQNVSSAAQAGGSERASSVDRLVEGSSLIEKNIEKAEESLPGKRTISRIDRKPSLNDENRRATYNASTEPVVSSKSLFSTFEGENKQLISVGLHTDHSYARSLARFAATLGPVAWRIASKRIEQALPSGFKFGRGWVEEYEPLPTPVLMLENCTVKEPPFFTKIIQNVDARKKQKIPTKPVSSKANIVTESRSERLAKAESSYKEGVVNASTLGRKSASFGPAVIKPTATSSPSISLPAKEQAVRVTGSEGRSSFFCPPANKMSFSGSPNFQQQNSQPRNLTEPQKKVLKQVELNCPPSGSQNAVNFVAERQTLNNSEMPASRSIEMVSKNRSLLASGSFKQPNINGVSVGGPPNGIVNNLDDNKMSISSSEEAVTCIPHAQEQGLTDPVRLMRILAEKAQSQQKSSNQCPVKPPTPSLRKEDSGNAAAAAARAWMSIGAGGLKPAGENTTPHKNQISADSLYNPACDLHSQVSRVRGETPSYGMHFQPEKNSFPFHPFVSQPAKMVSDARFQNQPMGFPQFVTADLSRFQVQSPWQPLSLQMQPRQKQESRPPDLNISFQSSGSPGRPASSVLVDTQQPDLALQL